LYAVVQNLEKHGFIEVAGNTRQGGRPERTVYRITDAGREEFKDWVAELTGTPAPEQPKFGVALSALGALGPDEAAKLLSQRLGALERQIARQQESLADHRREVPRLFLLEVEYELVLRETEAAWTRSLLDELTNGSFPGLAQWRAYDETGAVPAELTELVERGSTTD